MTLREDLSNLIQQWPKGFPRAMVARYVLQHGQRYDPAPLTADEVALVTGATRACEKRVPFKPGWCFQNAQHLMWAIRSGNSDAHVQYVEGFARLACVARGCIEHHAWVALNGKVVDVTWRDPRTGAYVLGTFNSPEEEEYLGVPFAPSTFRDALMDSMFLTPRDRPRPLLLSTKAPTAAERVP